MIFTLDIGGVNYGDVVLVEAYRLEKQITFGKCKSDNLKDFGKVEVDEEKGFIKVYPHKSCLESKAIESKEKPILEESYSLALNYYLTKDNVVLQPILFLKRFSLSGFYDREQGQWRDYRLVFDNPERDLRFTLGYGWSGGWKTLQGLYSRGVVLQRHWINQSPVYASTQLILTDRSVLEVYRDGKLLQKIELPAGIYDLRNLPLSGLSNELTLRITDSKGVREEKLFFLYSPQVLPEGYSDFSLGFFERGQFRGYYRYGLNKHLTLEVAGSNNKQGLGFTTLTKLGVFSVFVDSKKDYDLSYYTEIAKAGLTVGYRERDLRYNLSFPIGNFTVGLYGYKNQRSFVGLTLSGSLLKGTLSASVSKDNFFVGWTMYFGGGFGAGISKQKDGYGVSLYKSLLSSKEIDYGFRVNYQKNHTEYTSAELELKSINLIRLSLNKDRTSYSLSGSIGCVYEDGLECGLGLPVWDSFVVGKGLQSSGVKTFSLIPLSSYYNHLVISDTHSEKLSLYSGQGRRIRTGKDVLLEIYMDGKPVSLERILINGEEYITDDTGKVFVENAKGILKIEVRGKTKEVKASNQRVDF